MKEVKIDSNVQLIREKLASIPNALMCNLSNSDDRLPNGLVGYESVDEDGRLWLKMLKPARLSDCYEKKFPGRLLFYQKNLDYYLESSGFAEVELSTASDSLFPVSEPEYILLKFTPSFIQLYENRTPTPFWTKLNRLFSGIFRTNTAHPLVIQRMNNNKQYGY
jgi:hypothetical protein